MEKKNFWTTQVKAMLAYMSMLAKSLKD